MRSVILAVAAAVAVSAGSLVATSAQAVPLAQPTAVQDAANAAAPIENVHYRGWGYGYRSYGYHRHHHHHHHYRHHYRRW